MVNDAPNPEGVALLASCERFKVIDPTVISVDARQKKEIYLWTDEMMAMYDTMHDIANSDNQIVSGFGFTDGLSGKISAFEDNGHSMSASTWAQLKEANAEALNYYLDDLNQQIKDYEESQQ